MVQTQMLLYIFYRQHTCQCEIQYFSRRTSAARHQAAVPRVQMTCGNSLIISAILLTMSPSNPSPPATPSDYWVYVSDAALLNKDDFLGYLLINHV